jgi:FkbH-like protein
VTNMDSPTLYWLPEVSDWPSTLAAISSQTTEAEFWTELVKASRFNLDFIQTRQLDRLFQSKFARQAPMSLATKPIRLAILSSSTVDYLMPSIRVAGLRRGLWIETYINDYGQYLQELHNPSSGLAHFRPTSILIALDSRHYLGRELSSLDSTDPDTSSKGVLERITSIWRLVSEKFPAQIIQQTLLPIFPTLIGSNEHRVGSAATVVASVNRELRQRVVTSNVDLLAVDTKASQHGIAAWYDPSLWHRAKQEIHLQAAPLYGDLIARIEAARQGRSAKCMVLDLDNTIWGGVIGDDGLEGISLGQGSALGEAFQEMQHYALGQSRRGIILAVCSKNDEAIAIAPFSENPEMVLRSNHIAAFVANWQDKATNLRRIAEQLNIGIDALVFVDDNPFERNIVRHELPDVSVPELPDDPAMYPYCLSDAGYFEATQITKDDFQRADQYQENKKRQFSQKTLTDLGAYLASLKMELQWKRFDQIGLNRIVQLINKTNQFNLTTIRYTEHEIIELMNNANVMSFQIRLLDQFGDNGIISIIIGLLSDDRVMRIDAWLMSCRVLGRQVEEAVLNLIVEQSQKMGAHSLLGVYRPSGRNEMVRNHYEKLGFVSFGETEIESVWNLEIYNYKSRRTYIATIETIT